jgi:DNA-directed RNA polymerase subunit alpha
VVSLFDQVQPKIETEAGSQKYGKFSIGPLPSGYGVTLGNALRRVLLSSLQGAAVTSIRVSGVYHEFSDIPHCKEDMITLILNAKQLRLIMPPGETARLHVEVKGEGVITAADLVCPAHVEVVNPDLHLLTADSSEADLDLEFVVQTGKGYSPSEERGELPIGEIPVDTAFSPVRKANFRVERERVGQMTDFNRLIMEIWTDGSLRPGEALRQSAQILVRHFSLVAGVSDVAELQAEAPTELGVPDWVRSAPIEELELTVRAYNCLKRAGITKVGEILERLDKGEDEIMSIRNFGRKSLDELLDKLRAKGYLQE